MRLFAVLALAFFTLLPSAKDQQKGQSTKQNTVAQNTPSQTSPVTVIVNQPTNPERKDSPAEKPKNGPPIYSNWALVIVAGLAAIAGLRSLHFLKRQAIETEKAANAARDNALAVINAERAWLMVDVTNTPGYSSGGYSSGNTYADITLICTNDGATPCWVNEVKAGVAVIKRSDKPPDFENSTAVVFVGPMPVGVHKKADPIRFTLNIGNTPGLDEHVVIYGIVKYRHPFSTVIAATTFAYAALSGPWQRLHGFSDYNANT
jgi:type II secretory pathway pseudopilin PulG